MSPITLCSQIPRLGYEASTKSAAIGSHEVEARSAGAVGHSIAMNFFKLGTTPKIRPSFAGGSCNSVVHRRRVLLVFRCVRQACCVIPFAASAAINP